MISRKAILHGIQNIVIRSKTIIQASTILRGDLRRRGAGAAVSITIGSYSKILSDVVISPPIKEYRGELSYYPIKIGDFVTIEQGCVLEAVTIGNHVKIGKDCIIGAFVVIKDCCEIADGSIIAPFTVIPPFSHYRGTPSNICLQ